MLKKQKKSGLKLLKLTAITIFFVWLWIFVRGFYNAPLLYPENTTIQVKKGATINIFFTKVSGLQRLALKFWLRNNAELIPTLQEGKYQLSGSYTKVELLQLIKQGPQKNFTRATLLEGWSIYDIDQYLAQQGLLSAGQFIQKAQDQHFIQELKSEFSFLSLLPIGKSLEGLLYPDTYFLEQNSILAEELIRAQLKNFNQKIWIPFGKQLQSFGHQLTSYQVLILASVIENEEKHAENKPIIAGIFLNRLDKGMRLDADVTLCYGLKVTYDQCRQNILPNLNDTTNLYNTRANYGLMPTPISSPTAETLSALLNFEKTGALYYLHDIEGKIHYGTTLEEHNANKAKYL